MLGVELMEGRQVQGWRLQSLDWGPSGLFGTMHPLWAAPNRTYCIPRMSISRAMQPRMGVKFDVGRDKVEVGAEIVVHVHVNYVDAVPFSWLMLTSNLTSTRDRGWQGGHGGQGRAWAKAAAKLWVSKPNCSSRRFRQHCLPFHQGLGCHPTPVPTARLSHQTLAFCSKSSPRNHNPVRLSVLVPTWQVDNHSTQEQWTPAPRGGPRVALLFQHVHTIYPECPELTLAGRPGSATKAGRQKEMGRNVADFGNVLVMASQWIADGGRNGLHTVMGMLAELAACRPREMILGPVDPPRNHPWMGPWDTTRFQPLVRSREIPPARFTVRTSTQTHQRCAFESERGKNLGSRLSNLG